MGAPGEVRAFDRKDPQLALLDVLGQGGLVHAVRPCAPLDHDPLAVAHQDADPGHGGELRQVLGEGQDLAAARLDDEPQIAHQHRGCSLQPAGPQVEQVEAGALEGQGHVLLDARMLAIALHRYARSLVRTAERDVQLPQLAHAQAVPEKILCVDAVGPDLDALDVADMPADPDFFA